LETRLLAMRTPLPAPHWISYEGTGRNIWGRAFLRSHGRPGPVLQLDHDWLRSWLEKQADAAVLTFTKDLQSVRKETVNNAVEQVISQHLID